MVHRVRGGGQGFKRRDTRRTRHDQNSADLYWELVELRKKHLEQLNPNELSTIDTLLKRQRKKSRMSATQLQVARELIVEISDRLGGAS